MAKTSIFEAIDEVLLNSIFAEKRAYVYVS